jgi:hypothetical protein
MVGSSGAGFLTQAALGSQKHEGPLLRSQEPPLEMSLSWEASYSVESEDF